MDMCQVVLWICVRWSYGYMLGDLVDMCVRWTYGYVSGGLWISVKWTCLYCHAPCKLIHL